MVALCLAYPRLVEAALALRGVREQEAVQLAETWNNIRMVVAEAPRSHATPRLAVVQAALPEIFQEPTGLERPLPVAILEAVKGPHHQFIKELAAAGPFVLVGDVGDAFKGRELERGPRAAEFSGGRCACADALQGGAGSRG